MITNADQRRMARDAETRQQYAVADSIRSSSFDSFAAMVAERLEQGRRAYGDQSFTRPPSELASEIEEELADVCGWAFVLWCRLRRLRERLER